MAQRQKTGKFNGEYFVIHKSGRKIPVEATSKIYRNSKGEEYTCVITRDLTERIKTQQEMTRLDKLNIIGQMAAGIGHEIRNPLTTVRGYLQMLGVKPENLATKSIYDLMISELDRANSIITEFLSLARTKETQLLIQSLNDILHNLYPLIESDAFTQNKKIKYYPGIIPDLVLNKNEILQMVLNLTRNGLEAMSDGGCLVIATFLIGDEVVLTIEDEGKGIPEEYLEKLGTPFFTTKENGTGLGLATCFRIAAAHNAGINIQSREHGTKFLISFPVPGEAVEN